MKYSILILSIFLLFSCKKKDDPTDPSDKICIPSSLEANLIAYYPFIDGSIEDQKNNNDLTIMNNAVPSEGREGGKDCAYKFSDVAPNYLMMENPAFLNDLRLYSVSLWYKHTKENEGQYEVLLSREEERSQNPAANRIMSIGIYDINKATFFNNLHSVWDNNDENNLTDWYHLVATCNYDTKTMTLYQNGKLMDQKVSLTLDVVNPINLGDLFIGKFFNGSIDDIAIFNKELSQDEVLEMYSTESCCE